MGYYNTVAASYGLQAGLQTFSYAVFFMNDAAMQYLNKSGGWEVGSAPSLVVVDTGMARSLSTTSLQKGIYVFFFNQKGLMNGNNSQLDILWQQLESEDPLGGVSVLLQVLILPSTAAVEFTGHFCAGGNFAGSREALAGNRPQELGATRFRRFEFCRHLAPVVWDGVQDSSGHRRSGNC